MKAFWNHISKQALFLGTAYRNYACDLGKVPVHEGILETRLQERFIPGDLISKLRSAGTIVPSGFRSGVSASQKTPNPQSANQNPPSPPRILAISCLMPPNAFPSRGIIFQLGIVPYNNICLVCDQYYPTHFYCTKQLSRHLHYPVRDNYAESQFRRKLLSRRWAI